MAGKPEKKTAGRHGHYTPMGTVWVSVPLPADFAAALCLSGEALRAELVARIRDSRRKGEPWARVPGRSAGSGRGA